MDDSAEIQNNEEKVIFGARVVNPSDPDVFDNPDSARVRARQIGCIGIRRYNNRSGTASWMPCTNESDFRRVSGIGHSGRRFRRQEIEKEVRRVIGGRSGKKVQSKSANYTKPQLRETIKKRIMAGSKGGAPGQWSARKAQLVALAYRKAGGGYRGGKTGKQRSLSKWTKQKWRTSDGKRARRGGVTRRYLPASAWSRLTVGQRAATNRKKIQGSRRGEQFVSNTAAAKRARKRSSQGQKHIEFYEDFEFKAIGPRKGRSVRTGRGDGSFGRSARRLGATLSDRTARFDPNPIDADLDNVVQEGTLYERPAPPRKPVGVTPEVGGSVREPQINVDKPFSRAARMADGRYSVTAPEIATRVKPTARKIRKGAAKKPRFITKTPTKRRKLEQSQFDSVPVGRTSNSLNKLPTFKYDQDTQQSLRSNRSKIYNQYVNGESSISELADKFDVVRDEIEQEIKLHRKFRNKNINSFSKENPRLMSKIKKFTNSRTSYVESISEGKYRNWDGLVQYIFRSPDIKNTRQNMIDDLFKFFPSGKNPDRSSNIVLGYVPSASKSNKIPVKTFSDVRKPRSNFRSTNDVARKSPGTGTASSIAERPTRTYRRDNLRAEALTSNLSLTGKMASPMTPAEEVAWKKREWKRQQLKNLSVDPNASTKYPSLKKLFKNQDISVAIQALDALDDTNLETAWNDVVLDIAQIPNAAAPVYQVKQAPLSPRELAAIAPKRRPLVKVFVEEYKTINPNGIISNLDVDNMTDSDIESFYNTFILPELINTNSPTAQEVQQTIQLPTTQEKISDAERLLGVNFTSFDTLQYRLKVAKKILVEEGLDPTSPEFDMALEKLISETNQRDMDNFNNELQDWLNPGSRFVPKFAINPETGEPFTKSDLEKLINEVDEAVEILSKQINMELYEEKMRIVQVIDVLSTLSANEDFLEDPLKFPDPDVLPINPATGKIYTLREWVESGDFKLLRMVENPATERPFTKDELKNVNENLASQIDELDDKLGRPLFAEIGELQNFQGRLKRAYEEAGFMDVDVDRDDNEDFEDVEDGDTLTEEPEEPETPKTLEEIQQEYQELIDNNAEMLETKIDVPVEITPDSLKKIRNLLKTTAMQEEPRSSAPDTDEFWNAFGPGYAGDPDDPLNKPTYKGQPTNVDSPENLIQKSLLDHYLDSNYAREWSDIQNSHTIGKYTDVPEELAKYTGDFAEGSDPAKIDPRIQWDRLMDVLFQTNPELFRKAKNGEIIGQTLDNLAQELGMDAYGGASFSAFAGRTADTSGYQFKAQLQELAEAKRLSQAEQFLSSTKQSAAERTKFWNLFSVQTLTPEEIAFQEEITDINIVTRALNQHEVDNNISSPARNNLDNVARAAAKSRAKAFKKAKTQRLIDGIRELAQLSAPGSSTRATAKDLIATAERAKIFLQTTIDKIGEEYDQFRRTKQMLHGMVSSLLKTRPGNFKVDPKNPNKRNKFGQTGWDITKEPLARYLNRITRWDEENIGYTDVRTGEYKRGLVKILVDFDRSIDLQTGDPAGSSATTAIFQNARNQQAEIASFILDIENLETDAKSQGITGFMRSGGFATRATESTKTAARKAATGRASFADPNILKRYDRAGFNVTKRMLGQASGFNKQYSKHINESIKNNDRKISDAPGFNSLNPAEKDFLLLLEHVGNTPRMFDGPQNTPRNRGTVGRLNQSSGVSTRGRISPFKNRFRGKEYRAGITGRMGADRDPDFPGEARERRDRELGIGGYLGPSRLKVTASENFGTPGGPREYYVVDRNGQILSDKMYKTRQEAQIAAEKMQIKFAKQQILNDMPDDLAGYQAAALGIRQSGYKSTSLIRRNGNKVSPVSKDGELNAYIIKQDSKPKKRAADILIIRKNPTNGETEVLVITRKNAPHKADSENTVSLPGGFYDPKVDETLFDTANREAQEEVGITEADMLSVRDLGVIDAEDWDPRFTNGMEAAGLLIEVSPNWTPKAGDDAESAKFVSLKSLALGEYSLGFGHAVWLYNASTDEVNDDLSKYEKHFEVLNTLSHIRQRRIMAEANIGRRRYNRDFDSYDRDLYSYVDGFPTMSLFKDENEWDSKPTGYVTTGGDYARRQSNRLARVLNELSARGDADRVKRGLKPSTPRPIIEMPPGTRYGVIGAMRSSLIEMGPEEFSRIKASARKQSFVDDVLNLRLSGMDKYTISELLTNKFAIRSYLDKNPAEGNKPLLPELDGFSPTPELINEIISNSKKSPKTKISSINLNDKYTKMKDDDARDVMNLASEGFSVQDISNLVDISPDKVARTLKKLGMQEKFDNENVSNKLNDLIYRHQNSPIAKGLYIESNYRRLTLTELSNKYNMPESEILENINSYRNSVEKSEPEHHSMYRKAFARHNELISEKNNDKEVESINQLSGSEEQVIRMRLDGLSINDIAKIIKPEKSNSSTSAQYARSIEQSALAKLRNVSNEDFLGLSKELAVIRYRLSNSYSPLTGRSKINFKNNADAKYIMSSRELRDFGNSKKEQYLLNTHMNATLSDIANRYNTSIDEVKSNIDEYAEALEQTDNFKNKAIRRTLILNGLQHLRSEEIDFINMRNDGASLDDMAKLFSSSESEMRAVQMSVMTKFNNFNGLSGSMRSYKDIDGTNIYKSLSIDENETQQEIDRIFKAEVSRVINDALNNKPQANARLMEISKAYKILSDPELNNLYRSGDLNLGNESLIDSQNSWPAQKYIEPGTQRKRPNWVGDAILGEYNPASNMYKMPHDLGSDYITDDIDDGVLGFDNNDTDKSLASDMTYRKPQPGTPEWDKLKREAAQAKRPGGDTRIVYDADGFIVGRNMSFDPRFDDPKSPVYIGDKFGGPKKGSGNAKLLNVSLTGSMKSLVPEGSWSIGKSLKKKSENKPNRSNAFWERKGYDSKYLKPWSEFGEDLSKDYYGWLDLPDDEEDTEYFKEGRLNSFSSDFAEMGNIKTANLMTFSPIELLNAIDEFYESMPPLAREKATSKADQSYYGMQYFRYPTTTVRPFLRHVDSVPLLKDIASGKIREFVYYDRQLFPGKIINRDDNVILTSQWSRYSPDQNEFVDGAEERFANPKFGTELRPIELSWDVDPQKAEMYLKAVLIGQAISAPWLDSNSSNIETQLLHQSVRRIFNLTDSLDPTELPGAIGSYRLGGSDDLGTGEETLLSSLKKEYQLPPVLQKFLDDWVKTTYKQTQEYLDSLGDDEYLHLYRGASLPEMIDGRNTGPENEDSKEYREWLRSGAEEYENEKQSKEVEDFRQAPISSWTISPAWARVFSFGMFGPSEARVGSTRESTLAQLRGASVIDAPIPKELILSLPHSGLGTMQSGEVIVIGETLSIARVRHSDALPKHLWLVAESRDFDTNAREQPELFGRTWTYKGQRDFVDDLRSGFGEGLVINGSAEQYIASKRLTGKMASGIENGNIERRADKSPNLRNRFTASLNDGDTRYPRNSRPSEKQMRQISAASEKLRNTEIFPMAEVFEFEFSGPDGQPYDSGIITLAQRPVVIVRFYDKFNIPFYMSSGRGNKVDVPRDKWYPFWGVGKDGWFNKTNDKDILSYYNIYELGAVAKKLNEILPAESMPNFDTKWNNGDSKWIPRGKLSTAEKKQFDQDLLKILRKYSGELELDLNTRFEDFPIKDGVIRTLNESLNPVLRRNGDILPERINDIRKDFSNFRIRAYNEAKPNGLIGQMALPKRDWTDRDFYQDIEAERNDSAKTLRKKYRKFSLRYHPDKNKGDKVAEEKFKKGSAAWTVLSNSDLKKDYDDNFYPILRRSSGQGNSTPNPRQPATPNSNASPAGPRDATEQEAKERIRAQRRRKNQTPKPPRPNRRFGAVLPKLDDSFQKRINVNLPQVAHNPNSWDTMNQHRPVDDGLGVAVPTTFGGGKINVTDERFFDVYVKVATAMSDAVKTPNSNRGKKRFIIIGGAPGSGKSTLRKNGDYGIPKSDVAVHVDADEIKTIIPEAVAAHAAGDVEWASIAHEESRVISEMAQTVAIQRGLDVVYDSTGQFNRGFDTLKRARAGGYDIIAHYVVAPEATLRERIAMRQLSDPRVLPPHIVSATMSINKNTIPLVAGSADEFSLWESTSAQRNLLAVKTSGGSLEIKDSKAFLHADLESLVSNHPLFERPESLVITKSSDLLLAGQGNRAHMEFDIFLMFEDGKTVSEIATELKLSPRKVFDALTKVRIAQTDSETPSSRDSENADEYDIYDAPDIPEPKVTKNKKTDNYSVIKDNIMRMNYSVIKDNMMRMSSTAKEIITEITNDEKQRSGKLQALVDYHEGRLGARDMLQKLIPNLYSSADYSFEQLEDFVDFYYNSFISVFEDILNPTKSPNKMSDAKLAEYADSVLGTSYTKFTETFFKELIESNLPITGIASRSWAFSYDIPFNTHRALFDKYKRTGSLTGKMGVDNPFQDFNSTLDDLDDELKDSMQSDSVFGTVIKHPLLFWIGPINPAMVSYINNGISAKRKALAEAEKEKNWSSYIYLHERPYRINAFEDVMDQMSDSEYWENLSSIWVDSESIGTEPERWLELLSSERKSRDSFMNKDEQKKFAELPETFTVYRGYSEGDSEEFGMSWSTDYGVAEWFARRFSDKTSEIIIEEMDIAKTDAMAYLTRRGEDEIIIDMKTAKKRAISKQTLPPSESKARKKKGNKS